MSKAIIGFLLGVVMTLVVVLWLDQSRTEIDAASSVQSLPIDETAEMPQANPANRIDEAADKNDEEPEMSGSVESVANDNPLALQTQSIADPQQDPRTVSPTPSSPARTTDDQYPPEIAEMIENRVDKELQARYENDKREESWAAYMEGQLAAYFAQKPSLAQFYISLIDCRTSVCSVHVLGYGPDALTQWNTATADLVSQPWFEFNNMSMNRRNPEPDILAVVLILTKKPTG